MGFRVPEVGLQSLRTAKFFNGLPLINCATSHNICLANQAGEPRYIFPPSGLLTRVPQHTLSWRTVDEGILATEVEYGEPEDLPEDDVVAVISLEVYHDLHTWNANCGKFEQVDMSWMVVLGPLVEGYTNCYRGLIIPPDAKSNQKLIPKEFHSGSLAEVARYMVPEV